MAGNSPTTTDLGPRLSVDTKAHGASLDLTRAEIDFTAARAGIVRASSSATTSAGADGLAMDGELAILQDGSAATLAIRSGNTIYEFLSDAGQTI